MKYLFSIFSLMLAAAAVAEDPCTATLPEGILMFSAGESLRGMKILSRTAFDCPVGSKSVSKTENSGFIQGTFYHCVFEREVRMYSTEDIKIILSNRDACEAQRLAQIKSELAKELKELIKK